MISPKIKYDQLLNRYSPLESTKIEVKDTTDLLLIHLTLEASNYAKIKIRTAPKTENMGKPNAELTSFGWAVTSSGAENNLILHSSKFSR